MLSQIINHPQPHPKYQLCIIVPNGTSGTTLKHLYTSPRTGRKFASATHADNYNYEEAQKLLKSSSLNMISITVRQMNAVTSRITCVHNST